MSDKLAIKQEIDRLTPLLLEASKAYYNSGETILEDDQYDLLLVQLEHLEQSEPQMRWPNSPTLKVGTEPKGEFSKAKHKTPMLSLENISTKEELLAWGVRVEKELDGKVPEFCCETKLDGLSISVVYQKGVLVQAVTRGNGEVGDDVTDSVKTIATLPHQLTEPLDLELRGEVLMDKAQFAKLNLEIEKTEGTPFKNPRNAAAGSLRLKDTKEVKKRGLTVYFYDLVSSSSSSPVHHENLERLASWGLPISPLYKVTGDLGDVLSFCLDTESSRADLGFEIDGVVIKLNHLEHRARMGRTAKYPIWARAWKFRPQRELAQILSVQNSIGRTGVLTPVANVTAVQLAGTTVRRASLHNYQQVNQVLGLHHDDWVYIEKGGDIIPKVVGVELSKRSNPNPIHAPLLCPACEAPLVQAQKAPTKKGEDQPVSYGVDLKCENPECSAILQGQLEHFVSKKALDVNFLGPKMIQTLMAMKLVTGREDLFLLEQKQGELLGLEGLAELSVKKLLEGLEIAKTRPLNQLIFGLGISQLGEKAAKVIAMEVGTLTGFLSVTTEQLETLADMGPVLTSSLLSWLAEPKNHQLIETLITQGVRPTVLERPANQPFQGKIICITGTLSEKRSDWKFRLEQLGFKVTNTVSAKTHYLLCGEDGGSKVKKAETLGVTMLDEAQMHELLESES